MRKVVILAGLALAIHAHTAWACGGGGGGGGGGSGTDQSFTVDECIRWAPVDAGLADSGEGDGGASTDASVTSGVCLEYAKVAPGCGCGYGAPMIAPVGVGFLVLLRPRRRRQSAVGRRV